ncbi:hypothetical protein [Wenzhouxiangella sediminis]|uniref:CSLREA domain-containing protein n=1 Tax=Wenzhouxiangella sediminis TaxID=1792836 RepID=A0A3E1K895_9GAMM|nr:hypothetical protein [Wenzhouxiangella sediminis]RFF30290.1 hypothetical protein DZC52_09445 [Wenzhouxiangella sediminis]
MQSMFRLLPAAGLVLLMLQAAPAAAATIAVDTLDDTIDRRACSLRAAVQAAHTDRPVGACKAGTPGADTIRFRAGLGGAIRLKSPLYIESDLAIEGPGRDRLAISDGVVNVVTAGQARVDLENLEMRTGLFIRAAAAVNIRSVRFKSIRSRMSRASAIQVHGSRFGPVGAISIRHSSFEGNEGGDSPLAVVGETLRLSLDDVDFLGNAGDLSGGLLLDGAGPIRVDVSDSLFVGNQSLGGLSGAIASLDEAELDLTRSTFVGNRAQESGALFVVADRLRIANSVFERNGSPYAGAIQVLQLTGASGQSQLLFSTLVDNDRGGAAPALVNDAPDTLWLAGNLMRPGNAWAVCQPRGLTSMGYNLELDTGSCRLNGPGDVDHAQMTLYRTRGGTSAYPVPAPDPYHYAAVDAVPPYACGDLHGSSIDHDRLGRTRPVDYASGQPGANCDVGAIELRAVDALTPMP